MQSETGSVNYNEIGATLRELIVVCKDGRNALRAAAGVAQNRAIKMVLNSCARQRADFVTVLEAELRRVEALIGNDANSDGSAGHDTPAPAGLGRLVFNGDDRLNVAECERLEQSAIERYRQALQKSLPPYFQFLLDAQADLIEQSRKQMATLQSAVQSKILNLT